MRYTLQWDIPSYEGTDKEKTDWHIIKLVT